MYHASIKMPVVMQVPLHRPTLSRMASEALGITLPSPFRPPEQHDNKSNDMSVHVSSLWRLGCKRCWGLLLLQLTLLLYFGSNIAGTTWWGFQKVIQQQVHPDWVNTALPCNAVCSLAAAAKAESLANKGYCCMCVWCAAQQLPLALHSKRC